jgi:hypothetical protein
MLLWEIIVIYLTMRHPTINIGWGLVFLAWQFVVSLTTGPLVEGWNWDSFPRSAIKNKEET